MLIGHSIELCRERIGLFDFVKLSVTLILKAYFAWTVYFAAEMFSFT